MSPQNTAMNPIRTLLASAVILGAIVAPAVAPTVALMLAGASQAEAAGPVSVQPQVSHALEGLSERSAQLAVTAVPSTLGVIRPGESLTIDVTATNPTTGSLPAGVATLFVDTAISRDRFTVAQWLGGSDAALPATAISLAEVPTPPIGPGATTTLPAITVPAAALGFLGATGFEVHEFAVRVSTSGSTLGTARSVITAVPATTGTPLGLSIAVPITVPSTGAGVIPSAELEALTAPDGALTEQLDQAWGRPVALGIDPRILASIRLLGQSAPPTATAWLDRLAAAPNETFALGYADVDLSAMSQAGRGVPAPLGFDIDEALFAPAVVPGPSEAPAPTASPTPTPPPSDGLPELPTTESLLAWDYSLPGIAWPRERSVAGSDLATFAGAGLSTTILSTGNTTAEAESRGAIGTAAGVSAVIDDSPVLLSDRVVSDLIRSAATAPTETAWQSAMVSLVGALASIASSDNPGSTAGDSARLVFATVDRDWASAGSRLAQTLSSLDSLSWADAASMQAARVAPPTPVALVDTPVDSSRLDTINRLFESETAVGQFASVLADPALLTNERRLSLLAVGAQSWATDSDSWATAVTTYLDRSAAILGSVAVVRSSTINLLSDNGQLPITISNDLNFPVTVVVTVRPETAILAVKDPGVSVTVEANSQARASIPVQSVANGEVIISVTLSSPAGVPISQPTSAQINVQAGWETAATTILGGLLIVLLGIGILRTVRRRRRQAGAAEAAGQEVAAEQTASLKNPVSYE